MASGITLEDLCASLDKAKIKNDDNSTADVSKEKSQTKKAAIPNRKGKYGERKPTKTGTPGPGKWNKMDDRPKRETGRSPGTISSAPRKQSTKQKGRSETTSSRKTSFFPSSQNGSSTSSPVASEQDRENKWRKKKDRDRLSGSPTSSQKSALLTKVSAKISQNVGTRSYSSAVKQKSYPGKFDKEKKKHNSCRKMDERARFSHSPANKNEKILKEYYNILTPQRLRILSKEQPDVIVKSLVSIPWFEDLCTCMKKERVITANVFEFLLELLAKGTESNRKDDSNIIYCQLPDSLFLLKHIPYHLNNMFSTSSRESETVLWNAVKVLVILLNKIPACYESLPMNVLNRALEKLQRNSASEVNEKFLNDFSRLVEMHADLSKPRKREITCDTVKRGKYPNQGPPPDDFRTIQILPRHEDIFRDDNPYLRKNLVKGPYTDLEHYLDVHFRLLCEDFQSPLRDGISMLVARVEARRNDPQKMAHKGIGRIDDVYVYEGVRILDPICHHDGLLFGLTFDVSRFNKGYLKTSKRLTYGSLLCLSKDNFQTFFFATVANRDDNDLVKGKIDIKLMLNPHKKVQWTDDVFVMAESRAYFEACRYTLIGLQLTEDLPFQEYLVECRTKVEPPAYLQSNNDIKYDFSCIGKGTLEHTDAPALAPEQWPSASYLGLNDSQYRALATALTKELAIVQGPPGTGKTYVGLKVAKVLLSNREETDFGPILVICYTNHALDQFLEGIHEFQPKGIVRIGGRSSSEVMNGCSLKNFLCKFKRSRKGNDTQQLRKAKDELKEIVQKIAEVKEKLLPESLVREVVSKDVLESLTCDRDGYEPMYNEAVLRWLGLFSDDADLNDDDLTVLVEHDHEPDEFTTEPLQVESVQLSQINFSVLGTIKTATGGGIISRCLKHTQLSQMLFVDNDGCLTYQVIDEGKPAGFSVKGTSEIDDDKWHEVVITYENHEKKICLYVDGDLEAEKHGCVQRDYTKAEKEMILVGSNPFPKEPNKNEISVKELIYIPNLISLYHQNSDQGTKDPEELEVVYETDVIQEQRIIDGDHDIEGFEPQANTELTIFEKIFRQRKDDRAGWTVVKNLENELQKYENTLKNELRKKDFMNQERSEKVKDVWELKPEQRWQLYRSWVVAALPEYHWQMATKQVEYDDAIETYADQKSEEDAKILQSNATVIGMTTTGAAKRPKLLKGLGARVVIVEEAAEVLESHIVTALTRECEHLILIGDHKQLRPTPNVHDLVVNFHFDVSLFERMINNELHYECLEKQHRMRPEISQVCRHIYPDLQDHESVFRFENISGVKQNIFFVHHDQFEVTEEDTRSHVNKYEAKFVIALCKFFLQQGYKGSQITILTPYTGQLREIQKCGTDVLRSARSFGGREKTRGVHVTSIDNYQGEENDIILLSLVRSNHNGNIGFVKIENRVCVALSRARKGLYCIGNFEMIRKKSDLWRRIISDMESRGLVGRKLTLCCQIHDDKRVEVETAEDFLRAPNGGCSRICNKNLSCGHTCRSKCHPVDQEHVDQYRCHDVCEKFPCDLHRNRRCENRCSSKCSPCEEVVRHVLPNCEHEQEILCHIAQGDLSKIKCTYECPEMLSCGHQCPNLCSTECGPCGVLVKKRLPNCVHEVEMLCSEDPEEFPCKSQCLKILPCLHQCAYLCSRPCGKCKVSILRRLPGCEHQIELACFRDPSKVKCTSACSKSLDCGHPCTQLCRKDCDEVCNSQCSKELGCGHPCSKLCSEPCGPCQVVIEVVLPKCGHKSKVKCCQDLGKSNCPYSCQLTLDCGHQCTGNCSQKCIPCPVMVTKTIPGCGHECKIRCSAPLGRVSCPQPCHKTVRECGHKCQKKCGEPCSPCMQLIMKRCPRNAHSLLAPCSKQPSEVLCSLPCEKALSCGHNCGKVCSEPCWPCKKDVIKQIPRCGHQQAMFCSTKPEEMPCKLPCRKTLLCGHPCPNSCNSERCGPCNSTELVIKTLPSCGHENEMPCKQNPSEFPCKQFHFISLPKCGHKKSVPCMVNVLSCEAYCRRGNNNCQLACGKCLVKRLKSLPCGHKKHVACYKFDDEDTCLSCSSLFMKG